jgi:hypothetical protein
MMIAELKARELLFSFLTFEQKKSYLNRQGFTVIGHHTGLSYLLGYNFGKSIFTHRFCYCINLACDGYYYPYVYPIEDHILAQKIMIESDERRFLEIACITRRFTGFGE